MHITASVCWDLSDSSLLSDLILIPLLPGKISFFKKSTFVIIISIHLHDFSGGRYHDPHGGPEGAWLVLGRGPQVAALSVGGHS